MSVEDILVLTFFDNTVFDYLVALGIFFLTWIGILILKKIILVEIEKIAKRTKTTLDDKLIEFVKSVSILFYFALSLHVSLSFLKLPEIIHRLTLYTLFLVVVYYLVKLVQKFIEYFFGKIEDEQKRKYGEADTSQLHLMRDIVKGIVWFIAILILLSNLGFDITALIAGLGIGGIAVAFALQNVLADIFASFSIYFDKPFRKGDSIVVGNESGTIKKIGLKTTRIESLSGEEIVISNRLLVDSIIHNYKKMDYRRVKFQIGVAYETDPKKLEKIPQYIREIIESRKKDGKKIAEVNRVHFYKFGDFALIYEVMYTVLSNDYNIYMDVQQEINIELMKKFNKEKIEFAYPTQTLYLKKAE